MKVTLFDDNQRIHLLPLTYTRPAAELRVGILTISEKWAHRLKAEIRFKTADYLSDKYTGWNEDAELYINGRALPDSALISSIENLENGDGIRTSEGVVLAVKGRYDHSDSDSINWKEGVGDFISYPEDIFSKNNEQISEDYQILTKGRTSETLPLSNKVTGDGEIFIEPGAKVEGAILNPLGGQIYIGKDAEIMEGSLVRGSLALCEHATLKLGAKIYGATTIGPHSKVGGEVNNSVLIGFSNKGHDGFLGNSVLGEWCNLGADTNISNLKNNYAEVRIWDYQMRRFRKTGLQFCGLIMGDHSKCGINTMFNTGTVVGVGSNIFGSGFPRNYIPSFAWGGSSGFSTYQLNKMFETAEKVMQRRSIEFDDVEKSIIEQVFKQTSDYRYWEEKESINV